MRPMSDVSDLRAQLSRLGVRRGRAGLRPDPTPRDRSLDIEAWVEGVELETHAGRCFCVERVYEAEHRHGRLGLSSLLAHTSDAIARVARDRALAGVNLRRMVFLDTETTSLSGGVGTYVFMVGLGRFEKVDGHDCFVMRQYLMRDFDEQDAVVHLVGDLLEGIEALASFNGKAFDVPVLENRFVLARRPLPLRGVPHLDLLAPARRVWGQRLDSCSLTSLESKVLGVRRTQQDVPGYLIPDLYRQYVETGDGREMASVFYHNEQDVLSLVVLAASLCHLVTHPHTEASLPGEDLYGIGRLHEDQGLLEEAERAYQQALAAPMAAEVQAATLRHLGMLLKRQGRRQEAAEIWWQLAEAEGSSALLGLTELSKEFEWHQRDLQRAVEVTRRALDLVAGWPHDYRRRRALQEVEHRLARLERKLAQ